VQAEWRVSDIYLGEDGGPDGLNLSNLGGSDEGLELVGLYEDIGISWLAISIIACRLGLKQSAAIRDVPSRFNQG
jgi:hypothetical protein